jgi:hypothetical protein
MANRVIRLVGLWWLWLVPALAIAQQTASGPITISGQANVVIQGLKITSTTGSCVLIVNSTNITIQNSDIGPCSGGPDANAIKIEGGNGVYVYDNYIHPETLGPGCCDHEDGIVAHLTPQNVVIQGNVIAYGETNIEVIGGENISVVGNFLLNPRGPFPRGQNFQCGTDCSNITFQNNYTLSSLDTTKYLYPENQEDSVNFGSVQGFVVKANYVTGGHSPSGCGLIADTGAESGQFLSNLLLDTGECGIGIASGGNHVLDSNKVYNTTPVVNGGNVGIYIGSPTNNCDGPITVSNNISDEIGLDGTSHNGYHAGTCNGATPSLTLINNTFDQPADALLTPVSTVFPAPLIPPQPKNCVATSPYSTQTGLPACNPSSTIPNPPAHLTAIVH